MEVIFMNIETAQICNIVLATKSALKKRNRIRYKPIYYEKKVEFVFFNNKKYFGDIYVEQIGFNINNIFCKNIRLYYCLY